MRSALKLVVIIASATAGAFCTSVLHTLPQ